MEHARCLYLVDDFDCVYKQLQRPTAAVAKTRSSIQLTKTIKVSNEDERVRQYVAELHRYLNIGEPRPQTQQQKGRPIGPINTDKLLPLAPPLSPATTGRQLRLRSAPKRTLQVDTDTDDDDVFAREKQDYQTEENTQRQKT